MACASNLCRLLVRCSSVQHNVISHRLVGISSTLKHPKPWEKEIVGVDKREKDFLAQPPDFADNTVEKKKGMQRKRHSLETSIKYLESETFKKTYRGVPVWHWYRRNIIGQEILQPKPRPSCLDEFGVYRTNNPCPVCKDEYLILDHRNIKLLEMFMIEKTDQPIPILRSGLCRDAYRRLEAMILKSKDHGLILFDVPYRVYDYNEYYPWKDWGEPPKIPEDPQPMANTVRRSYKKYQIFMPDKRPAFWAWYEDWDKFVQKSHVSY